MKNKYAILLAIFLLITSISQTVFPQHNKESKNFIGDESEFRFPFDNCWSHITENGATQLTASDNASIFFTTNNNSELISINSSGKIQWKTELGGQVTSNLLVNGDSIFLTSKSISEKSVQENAPIINQIFQQTNQVSMLRSVNRYTGLTNWAIKIFNSEKVYLFDFRDSIISIGEEGSIKTIKMSTKETVWENTVNARLSSPPFVGYEQIALGTLDGHIIQWSLTSGKQIGKVKVSSTPTALTISTQNRNLFWGDERGSVFSAKNTNPAKASKNFKNEWQFRNGAKISHLTLTSAGLLVSSNDNFVYLLLYEDGEIVWKKRFASRISSEPFVTGRFAMIMTTGESDVSIIETNSGKTVNKISLQNENGFTNSPLRVGNQIIFPTFNGVFSFSPNGCVNEKKEASESQNQLSLASFQKIFVFINATSNNPASSHKSHPLKSIFSF